MIQRQREYKDEYAKQAEKLCKLGATDIDLADFFGVSEQSINVWKKKHPAFKDALTAGKEEADALVEKSLFRRATGYSHAQEHISTSQGEVFVTDTIKHYPPDTVACIFWLKNRKPKEWRDKVETEHSGHIKGLNANELTDEQLAIIAAGSSNGANKTPNGEK